MDIQGYESRQIEWEIWGHNAIGAAGHYGDIWRLKSGCIYAPIGEASRRFKGFHSTRILRSTESHIVEEDNVQGFFARAVKEQDNPFQAVVF